MWTRSNLEDDELKKIYGWIGKQHVDNHVSLSVSDILTRYLSTFFSSTVSSLCHESRQSFAQDMNNATSIYRASMWKAAQLLMDHLDQPRNLMDMSNLLDMWWNRIYRVDVEQKKSIHSIYMYLLQVAGVLQKSCPSKCPDASMMSEMDRNGVLSGSRFLRFQRGKAVEDCTISDTYLTFRIAALHLQAVKFGKENWG